MGKVNEDAPIGCDKKWCNYVADQLENYIDTVTTFLIPVGSSKKVIDESVARVNKCIKRLRKGEVSEKDFDFEELTKFMEETM